jgi:hypothetical protein
MSYDGLPTQRYAGGGLAASRLQVIIRRTAQFTGFASNKSIDFDVFF